MSEQQGAALSFGFGARSKAAARKGAPSVQPEEDGPRKVLLSAVEAGGVFRTVDGGDAAQLGQAPRKTYIIPKIENSPVVGKKGFAPSFVPPASDAPAPGQGGDKFELAAPVVSTITEYGLQRREQHGREGEEKLPRSGGIAERLSNARKEEQAYHKDIDHLPDMAEVEAYEAMPIEEFGMAMLRGMGWTEGMGVGKNRKVVEAIEYLKRPERLGLGAQAVMEAAKAKKPRKMGDAPEVRREELVLAPDADGRQRHIRKLDEKLVLRQELQPGPRAGKEMAVVSGRHEGLRCVVVEAMPKKEGREERWLVKLKPSDEEAEVRSSDLADLAELAFKRQQEKVEARAQQQQQQEQREERDGRGTSNGRGEGVGGRGSGRGRGRGEEAEEEEDRVRSRDRERERDERGKEKERGKDRERERDRGDRDKERERGTDKRERGSRKEDREPTPPSKKRATPEADEDAAPGDDRQPWLLPNIVVRVIDKHASGGKVYLKKGVVVDVHPGGRADVSMDEGGQVLQLSQTVLETVIPKGQNAAVVVVAGRLRGSKARLLQSNTAEGVAAVQLAADFTVHRLMLDDVCQYVGPMDEED